MFLQRLNSNQIKINMTAAELKKIGVFTKKKFSDSDARKIIGFLMTKSAVFMPEGNFNLNFKGTRKGGMEIMITKTQNKITGGIGKPLIFRFEDDKALSRAAAEISRRHGHKILSSDLYLYKDNYYLIIYPLIGLSVDFFILLGEFSFFYGYGREKVSSISEHSRLLEKGRAIEKLCL